MTANALRHIKKNDKRMARLIKKVGPMRLKPELKQSPFAALVEAIVYQQLHGKAAATIFKRVLVLFPKRKFPKPEDFLNTPDKTLRSAGLSGAKTAAIKDLSQKMLDGVIPTLKQIEKMTDDEIVERISSVRGIGRWTVEMLLIFKLGRPDVLPATDFAIRKAFGQIYKQKEMPPPKAILEFGEIWRPHRTTAAWYLWRSLDL